jgi:hypothetical protein
MGIRAWPPPPARMLVVFCSVCDEYLGIQDVDRMQHEHFDRSEGCGRGFYRAAVYEQKMLGDYGDAICAMRVTTQRDVVDSEGGEAA